MTLDIVGRAEALLDSITTSQLAALPPAERQRFASAMWRVLHQMGRIDAPPQPKSGVLADIADPRGRQ
jgi:hypothetical protein